MSCSPFNLEKTLEQKTGGIVTAGVEAGSQDEIEGVESPREKGSRKVEEEETKISKPRGLILRKMDRMEASPASGKEEKEGEEAGEQGGRKGKEEDRGKGKEERRKAFKPTQGKRGGKLTSTREKTEDTKHDRCPKASTF